MECMHLARGDSTWNKIQGPCTSARSDSTKRPPPPRRTLSTVEAYPPRLRFPSACFNVGRLSFPTPARLPLRRQADYPTTSLDRALKLVRRASWIPRWQPIHSRKLSLKLSIFSGRFNGYGETYDPSRRTA